MSEYLDAIVFIDRCEAKVFHFRAADDGFLRRIVGSLDHIGHTLIVGPGNSRFELQTYLERHKPDLASRISGVQRAAQSVRQRTDSSRIRRAGWRSSL